MQAKPDLADDFKDFLEESLCGYVTTDPDGIILQANSRFLQWTGHSLPEVVGKRFSGFLSVGGKIYYETHLSPLLRMQQYFDEIALELSDSQGQKLPVLVNGYERRNEEGIPQFTRLAVFKAADRRTYEENLRHAKTMAEQELFDARQLSSLKDQFIAVLGHDLRNPLGSIVAGSSLLAGSGLDADNAEIVNIISRSASRMTELIKNIMDFARTRLGGGIVLERKPVNLEPVLSHVVNEAKMIWPGRSIIADLNIDRTVDCDADRIAQLFSNLLTNAITHGTPDTPVYVHAAVKDQFELSVINNGVPIPPDHIGNLFEPFTREATAPNQNGLGLGLFIAAKICRAHGGQLSVISNDEKTEFTFRMACER
ncbi:MAG TPA: PAS domain-containing sensor histidine kinase [Chitinophagaceae bacterium]|jgi:sigma-B regulation protein RsbU (phosphoserine phosphatase)|nr:PAS domain-containing sensor histidine kinase [Chitinophagaceae bacterium]